MKACASFPQWWHGRRNNAADWLKSTQPMKARTTPRGGNARQRRSRSGAAAVEFAIVLPLLLLLFLGACDFGRFAHTQVAVSNAARAGAGQASRHRPTTATRPQWEAGIRLAVGDELKELAGFEANRLAITIAWVEEPDATSRASVQVSYPFRTLVSWGVIPDLFTFRETVVFRIMQL